MLFILHQFLCQWWREGYTKLIYKDVAMYDYILRYVFSLLTVLFSLNLEIYILLRCSMLYFL